MCETALFFIYHFEEFFTVSTLHVEYVAHFFLSGFVVYVCLVYVCFFYLDIHVRFSVFMTAKKKRILSESNDDVMTESPMHTNVDPFHQVCYKL